MKQSYKSRGFTLVELIIVIAIIGILTAIVFVNLAEVRKRSRDTKRVSDLSQIQLALALYLDKYRTYPDTIDAMLATGDKFLPSKPLDPYNSTLDGIDYTYSYAKLTSPVIGYCLGATLENNNSPFVQNSATCSTLNSDNNYKILKQ